MCFLLSELARRLPSQQSGKLTCSSTKAFVRQRTTRALPPVNTGGAGLVIHRPKLPVLATQQRDYLVGYFQSFEDALFADAANGFSTRNYRNYIEPVSWVDHNLFCGFAKNVDALRLSAYFLKDRGRRIEGAVKEVERGLVARVGHGSSAGVSDTRHVAGQRRGDSAGS